MADPAPLVSSQQSTASLPAVGYTLDQLCDYVMRRLGKGVFVVELPRQDLIDCANDALRLYSIWRPQLSYGAVTLNRSQTRYLEGVDLGLGPVAVNFVQKTNNPAAVFWGNLISVAPLMMTGVGDYDMFLRWQKTWARVMSVQPDWAYDEVNKVLLIHNPTESFHCGVIAYTSYTDTIKLDRFGADWVAKYTFERSRLAYAEIMNKFSGAIPGPVRDLQLDQQKRDKAEAQIEKLELELKAAQLSTPLGVD